MSITVDKIKLYASRLLTPNTVDNGDLSEFLSELAQYVEGLEYFQPSDDGAERERRVMAAVVSECSLKQTNRIIQKVLESR